MPAAHRDGDLRACGAKTVVTHQNFCMVNGKLWAVEGDPNTHDAGGLIPTRRGVCINGIPVIVNTPDLAKVDGLGHEGTADETAQGSGGVFAYGR